MEEIKKCITCDIVRKDCMCCPSYHYIENSVLFYCDRNKWVYLCDDYYLILEGLFPDVR